MRRNNNIDILRLLFAWIVVFGHSYDLSLAPVLSHTRPFFNTGVAVEGFFAISGCLIVASWDRTKTAKEYFSRRARRIFPAYILAIVFCLVLGTVFTTLPFLAFWKSLDTWKYIFYNLLFLNFGHPGLPGVFLKNNFPAMDGALWTIKIEVVFYIMVPLLVWLVRRIGAAWATGSIFAASVAYSQILSMMGHETLARQIPGQLKYFMIGTAVYYYFAQFEKHRRMMWSIALILVPLALIMKWDLPEAIGVPLLTLCVAFLLKPYRGITAHGDFSYGTYVLHFPIIQSLIACGAFAFSPLLAQFAVIPLVVGTSVFSWFCVERVFLRPARVRQQERELTGLAV